MRIAVAGGTGVAGRATVAAAEVAGHQVVSLSRAQGVDVRSGDGLAAALEGVEVVIDTLNIESLNRKKATAFFVEATARLQDAATVAGVARSVLLSIVGIDRVPKFGYYGAKVEHEAAARRGPIPPTVLRATQFHEFAGQVLDRGPLGPVAVVPSMRIRPVAVATVGRHLVRLAGEEPVDAPVELAGPDETTLVDLARRTVKARGDHRVVVPVRLPGSAGAALAGGAVLPGSSALIDGPGIDEWLESVGRR